MCTVTWLREADGYVLFCNRDERHTRRPALGPRASVLRGVSFIAPADGDHGGSWIGVNEFGLTLCLLNRYGDPEPATDQPLISRGLLLTELLDCHDDRELIERLAEFQLNRFRAFTLLVLSRGADAVLTHWTGREFEINTNAEALVPLTSTSLNEPGIAATRRAQYEQLKLAKPKLSIAELQQFHRSHFPERGPYSVCMHREGAATVSLSIVNVRKEQITFSYAPGPPCRDAAVKVVGLR
jgi:uncharacterized protein with NRDE domain